MKNDAIDAARYRALRTLALTGAASVEPDRIFGRTGPLELFSRVLDKCGNASTFDFMVDRELLQIDAHTGQNEGDSGRVL